MRVSLIPIFVSIYYSSYECRYIATTTIFIIAAMTDWLDGYLARKLNQVSPFGKFLDPVADKLLVAIALILLTSSYQSYLIAIPTSIIVGREIIISALREWMAELGKSSSVAVSSIGKLKTLAQMGAITALLIQPQNSDSYLSISGFILLYISALLTLWSMVNYFKASWSDISV